ncbi:MAG: hypothetical protein ACYTG0_12055 [Planctomycetota bacterium]|jgi:hypothetical protein
MKLWLAAVISLAALGAPAAEPPKPIALHPDNPHYFLWRGKPTVLITSGEHYGALLNLDFDYVRYFDALEADGLNHTRTFSGVYREIPSSFGITDNPLAPKPHRYICPWARSNRPGYRDGGNKFDLTRWDPAYFKRLAEFMACARRRGVVVEMNLFCTMYRDELWDVCPMNAANNVNGVGKCPRQEVFTLKHRDLTDVQLALVRKMVDELRDYDNLYYEVCNEPYFHGVTMDWQHKIVDAIVEAEKDFPAKHLVSLNVANGRQKVERPHPGVSIFNFHYCVPPDTVAMNYRLNRVIGENETGFRGRDDLLYRTEGWDFLIAGGALYNNLDYSFTPKHPNGTFRKYQSPGGGSPDLRKQLGVLKQFTEGLDLVSMKPDDSVIRAVSPEASARALVARGKAYALYVHVPLPRKPKDVNQHRRTMEVTLTLDLPAGTYQAQWVDTKTGKVGRADAFGHRGGQKKLRSPRFSDDVALRIFAEKE